ncbi:hypothetical protein QVZ41_13985 [Wenyingzhuangia sp. chi5]|uniref:Lipoprotein n=1 Tax=Wenyingzhuangia gilva TaxID=3057677 RepID=A0ABT8VVK1_9FLAO|nr:hypothetical protein [Wenyingzhuangia sp. chi5]MDO3695957.1 hypothetical protein [Wenyingzhuangia sp. chi5]
MKKIILTSLLTLSLSSCSYFTYYNQTGYTFNSSKENLELKELKIYSGDIEDEYEIVGSVSFDIPGGISDLKRNLKKKLNKIGADAIINVKLNKSNSFMSRTGITGTAIKLK